MRPRWILFILLCLTMVATSSFGRGISAADPQPAGKTFTGRSTGLRVTPGLPGVLEPRDAVFGWLVLPYLQQEQEWDQWCWAADGASIANYLGHWIDQNDYCKLVHGADANDVCPNDNASLEDIAKAFGKIGFDAKVGSPFSMTRIVEEISANRPILTGIAWAAGGGHAQVVYGYDADAGTITYGDPWPTSQRQVTQTLASYTKNPQWIWFGEDYRIAPKE
ncbi:papain-like cysteine protease family protein [Nocardia arthritidis]|uniref:papain-like cysteine protease family protein n=1 Tax=Nocardia arthritidis TaxID=228602 RepID=UPI00142D429A|nr:papain-like cysteine protease family protein [Nocardia arthritidis]